MYCKHCGKEIDHKAEHCVHCGRRVRDSFSVFLGSNEITKIRPVKDAKSPGLSAFLGFFLSLVFLGPLGYLYLGQWNWFWLTLIISVVAYPLTGVVGAYIIFPFVFAFHQYQMAQDINDSLPTASPNDKVAGAEETKRAPDEG